VQKAGLIVANDVQKAGITVANSIESAGVSAANALEATALESAKVIGGAYLTAAASTITAINTGLTNYALNQGQIPVGTPPSGGSCFPGNAKVQLENGDSIFMKDLKNGMNVLSVSSTGTPLFSEVFTWIVRDPDVEDVFLELRTETGKSLRLSQQHYVHVTNGSWDDTVLLSAQEVQLSDLLWVDFKPSKVIEINTITEKGVFSPVTVEGSIVVDSVTASCVTTYEDIIGSGFKTLYLTKRTPPMMIHHWFLKTMYKFGGKLGMRIMDTMHRPLYFLAGRSAPSN
jgi:hypothetical protein